MEEGLIKFQEEIIDMNSEELSCNDVPRIVLEYFFNYLNFSSLLMCRRVCSEWNSIIMDEILPPCTIFHILPNPYCQYWIKQLKKSKCSFIPYLSGKWNTIHIHNLSKSISLWKWKTTPTSYIDFTQVTNLTIYEGDFTLKQFVCQMLSKMVALRHLHITEAFFTGKPSKFTYYDIIKPFNKIYTKTNNWKYGLETIEKLESFRINIHSWISTIVYIKLMSISKNGNLNKIGIDFSKIYGLPLDGNKIEETYTYICDLISHNATTLIDFRIKWYHRVETDTDIIRYEDEHEYFLYFLDILGSPKWPSSDILQLEILELGFPYVNFQSPLIDLVFVPFLKKQKILKHLFLARIYLSHNFNRFNSNLNKRINLKKEYGIYLKDIDIQVANIPYNNTLSSIEIHMFWSITFHMALHPIIGRRSIYINRSIIKKAPQVASLKLYNSKLNTFYLSFNTREIIYTFPNLRQLELLDERNPDDTTRGDIYNNKSRIGDRDLYLIIIHLPLLISLKMSSLTGLTDSGITGIDSDVIDRMKRLGNYYGNMNEIKEIPLLSRMKYLKFLELRNLTENVTDVSIFYGFQHIPKLEKIAFHGEHKITSWGTKLLERKFKNNPRFAIFLKKFAYIPFYNDFP